MSGVSIETRLALQEQRQNQMMEMLVRIEQGQVAVANRQSGTEQWQAGVEAQLIAVQKQLDGHSPTINEMITIRAKVEGAGVLGKFLWGIGIALLSAAATAVALVLNMNKLVSGGQ